MKTSLLHLALPMAISFAHAKADRLLSETLVLVINYQGKVYGLGECVPREYVTHESISSVTELVKSIDFDQLENIIDESSLDQTMLKLINNHTLKNLIDNKHFNAACLIETALLDLVGKLFNQSLCNLIQSYMLPSHLQNTIRLSSFATSQVMDLSLTPQTFLETRGPFHYIKIKLSSDIDQNIRRVSTIRNALPQNISITVDANMAWDYAEAVDNAAALSPYNIQYYEEPMKQRDYANYRRLRQKTDIKILLDESLCSIEDAQTAVAENACDAFNIRLSKCGGITNSIKLIEIAHTHDLSYQLGAQVAETGPLIAASRQLASVTKDYFAYEAGQPDRYFKDYIVSPMPLVDRTTNLAHCMEGPGLGILLNNEYQKYLKAELTI